MSEDVKLTRAEYADLISAKFELQSARAEIARLTQRLQCPDAEAGKQLYTLAFDGMNITAEYAIEDGAVVVSRMFTTAQDDISEFFSGPTMERLEAAIDRRLQAEWREDYAADKTEAQQAAAEARREARLTELAL
jgi:hypothetical protein